MRSHTTLLAAAIATGGILAATQQTQAATIVVNESSPDWGFFQEGGSSGTSAGQFEPGPGTPPLGTGSATLILLGGNRGHVLASMNVALGAKLADFTQLAYQTYTQSGSSQNAIALQARFDKDVTDLNNSFQGTVVFEPRSSVVGPNPVLFDTWQNWDPLSATDG